MKSNIHFWSYLAHFLLQWEMVEIEFVEKTETHIIFSIIFYLKIQQFVRLFKKKYIVEWGGLGITIWRMHIACWIPKAANTHTENVILTDFPLQHWLRESALTLRHTYIACPLSRRKPASTGTWRDSSSAQRRDETDTLYNPSLSRSCCHF